VKDAQVRQSTAFTISTPARIHGIKTPGGGLCVQVPQAAKNVSDEQDGAFLSRFHDSLIEDRLVGEAFCAIGGWRNFQPDQVPAKAFVCGSESRSLDSDRGNALQLGDCSDMLADYCEDKSDDITVITGH
jgi:hypothetical protein